MAPAALPAAPPKNSSPSAGTQSPAKLPDFTAAEITLQDFKVDVTDLAAPRPAQLALSGLQVSVKNVTLAEGAVLPLAVSFDWAPHGTVQLDGSVTLIVAGELHLLQPGDTLAFPGHLPHSYLNRAGEPARGVSLVVWAGAAARPNSPTP